MKNSTRNGKEVSLWYNPSNDFYWVSDELCAPVSVAHADTYTEYQIVSLDVDPTVFTPPSFCSTTITKSCRQDEQQNHQH